MTANKVSVPEIQFFDSKIVQNDSEQNICT